MRFAQLFVVLNRFLFWDVFIGCWYDRYRVFFDERNGSRLLLFLFFFNLHLLLLFFDDDTHPNLLAKSTILDHESEVSYVVTRLSRGLELLGDAAGAILKNWFIKYLILRGKLITLSLFQLNSSGPLVGSSVCEVPLFEEFLAWFNEQLLRLAFEELSIQHFCHSVLVGWLLRYFHFFPVSFQWSRIFLKNVTHAFLHESGKLITDHVEQARKLVHRKLACALARLAGLLALGSHLGSLAGATCNFLLPKNFISWLSQPIGLFVEIFCLHAHTNNHNTSLVQVAASWPIVHIERATLVRRVTVSLSLELWRHQAHHLLRFLLSRLHLG